MHGQIWKKQKGTNESVENWIAKEGKTQNQGEQNKNEITKERTIKRVEGGRSAGTQAKV